MPIAATSQNVAYFVSATGAPAPQRYSFKHSLVQEAAYGSLPKRARQEHHRRVAEALETQFPRMVETRPEVVAAHYANGGAQAKAVDFYVRAGERARSQGATLEAKNFFNSLPAIDMVATLHAALARLAVHGPVAAVGPVAEDLRNGDLAPFVRIGFPLNRKIPASAGQDVRCDFLITSGSLLPMAALDAVGGMDEGLFIDNVDLEWSFRAAGAGHALHGVGDARMGHRIGEGVRRLPFGASFVHSPVRLYYMMRNRVLLYRRAETPGLWIAQDVPRALLKLLRFSLLVPPRGANTRAMLAGLRDGLLGRSGAKPDNAG